MRRRLRGAMPGRPRARGAWSRAWLRVTLAGVHLAERVADVDHLDVVGGDACLCECSGDDLVGQGWRGRRPLWSRCARSRSGIRRGCGRARAWPTFFLSESICPNRRWSCTLVIYATTNRVTHAGNQPIARKARRQAMDVEVVGRLLSTLPEDDDHPYRTGPWRPQTTEWQADDLQVVEGEIPKDLDGCTCATRRTHCTRRRRTTTLSTATG